MADEPNLKESEYTNELVSFGREAWDWLSHKKWVWLTNCEVRRIDFIMQVEEMYGQQNVQIQKQAYDHARRPLSQTYCAIFVNKDVFLEMFNAGEGVLPK